MPLRLATVAIGAQDRVAAVLDGGVLLLDEQLPGLPAEMRALVDQWPRWEAAVLAAGEAANGSSLLPPTDVRWRPPLVPRKLICVGANYHDHVAEMEAVAGVSTPPPPFPYGFLKPPSTTVVGSGETVRRPAHGRMLDWEAELAVVIGDPALAAGEEPMAGVFGYTILNDLSLRDFVPFPHALGLDAIVSKGFDGAAPIGPTLTLANEVDDPGALPVELSVNGEPMQRGSTKDMIFSVPRLVSHFARVVSLEPGDVIATGTPAGVGAGRRPPRYLRPGDEIEVSIGELGCLRTTIAAPSSDEQLPAGVESGA